MLVRLIGRIRNWQSSAALELRVANALEACTDAHRSRESFDSSWGCVKVMPCAIPAARVLRMLYRWAWLEIQLDPGASPPCSIGYGKNREARVVAYEWFCTMWMRSTVAAPACKKTCGQSRSNNCWTCINVCHVSVIGGSSTCLQKGVECRSRHNTAVLLNENLFKTVTCRARD